MRSGRSHISHRGLLSHHRPSIRTDFGGRFVPPMLSYSIVAEKCRGCGRCKKVCPAGAISGLPKEAHTIDASKCLSCCKCADACRHEAIVAVF